MTQVPAKPLSALRRSDAQLRSKLARKPFPLLTDCSLADDVTTTSASFKLPFLQLPSQSQGHQTIAAKTNAKSCCQVEREKTELTDISYTRGCASKSGILDNYRGERNEEFIKHGIGAYFYENKYYKYLGGWLNGVKEGWGMLEMNDGTSVEGNFSAGEIVGYGIKKWSNGNRFEGEFYQGEMNGRGHLVLENGIEYTGDFVQNERHGYGVMRSKEYVYDGDFCHGKKHGSGTAEFSDGWKYTGEWMNDMPHGTGKMEADGIVLQGLFECGRPKVKPTRISPCIEVLEGVRGLPLNLSVEILDQNDEPARGLGGLSYAISAWYKYPDKPKIPSVQHLITSNGLERSVAEEEHQRLLDCYPTEALESLPEPSFSPFYPVLSFPLTTYQSVIKTISLPVAEHKNITNEALEQSTMDQPTIGNVVTGSIPLEDLVADNVRMMDVEEWLPPRLAEMRAKALLEGREVKGDELVELFVKFRRLRDISDNIDNNKEQDASLVSDVLSNGNGLKLNEKEEKSSDSLLANIIKANSFEALDSVQYDNECCGEGHIKEKNEFCNLEEPPICVISPEDGIVEFDNFALAPAHLQNHPLYEIEAFSKVRKEVQKKVITFGEPVAFRPARKKKLSESELTGDPDLDELKCLMVDSVAKQGEYVLCVSDVTPAQLLEKIDAPRLKPAYLRVKLDEHPFTEVYKEKLLEEQEAPPQ